MLCNQACKRSECGFYTSRASQLCSDDEEEEEDAASEDILVMESTSPVTTRKRGSLGKGLLALMERWGMISWLLMIGNSSCCRDEQ